jgi:hypothetical protein
MRISAARSAESIATDYALDRPREDALDRSNGSIADAHDRARPGYRRERTARSIPERAISVEKSRAVRGAL